jgi:hypothetical protein
LGNSHNVGSRVGNSRTTGFADYAHRFTVPKCLQVLAELMLVCMLTHLIELGIVNGELTIHLAEEPSGRTDVLYDKVSDTHDDIVVVRGNDLFNAGLSQCDGNEI